MAFPDAKCPLFDDISPGEYIKLNSAGTKLEGTGLTTVDSDLDYEIPAAANQASLQAAINAAAAANVPCYVYPGNYAISSALTVNANCIFPKGAVLTHSAGGSIAFSVQPNIGIYQVFSGFDAGDITGLTEARTEWFNSAAVAAASVAALGNKVVGLVANGLSVANEAQGDVIYHNGTTWVRLAKGTALQGLQTNSGATAPEWAASPQSVLTGQGDLLYTSSANTLARLAIGAANSKLFTNAAGNAPEYAAGIKVYTLSRDLTASSGDVAYTDCGFKPSAIIFLSSSDGTAGMSIGMDDATNHYCVYYNQPTADNTFKVALSSIYIQPVNGAVQSALVKTMDAAGFTLTWTKTGSPTGTGSIYYMAFR